MTEFEVALGDGTLHAYDTGPADGFPVFWHHGTPNIGAPPAPLFGTAARLGLRFVSFDRPGYGGSTRRPGRSVGMAAGWTAAVADALGIDRFAVLGHSGGGPHALACAALLPERVAAAVSISGLAPYAAPGLDWYAGMAPAGEGSLRAAAAGRAAKEEYEATAAEADPGFTAGDMLALQRDWAWLLSVVNPALAAGPEGLIDDDLAYVGAWGFDPADVSAPVLLLHGGADRVVPPAHSEWLAGRTPAGELRLFVDDGHISVLHHAAQALEWLAARVRHG